MRAIAILLFLVAVAQDAQATPYDIQGGIICSNGKDAFYRSFKTEDVTNLTADIKDAAVKDVFAVSETAREFIWVRNDRFYIRELPAGKPYVVSQIANCVRENGSTYFGKGEISESDFAKKVLNLGMSPVGKIYSNEREVLADSNPIVPATPQLNELWRQERASGRAVGGVKANPNWPLCVKQKDNLAVSLTMYVRNGIAEPYYSIAPGNTANGTWLAISKFGGVRLLDLEASRRIHSQSISNGVGTSTRPQAEGTYYGDLKEYGINGMYLSVPQTIERFSIKRNAFHSAWSKNNSEEMESQLFAVIYQTANGWGPVEIRDATPPYKTVYSAGKGMKPGWYEIPVLLPSCQCLAWKPDDSLTILSAGTVFELNGKKIKEGIEASGVVIINNNPKGFEARLHANKRRLPVPENNVFSIKPELVAQGIVTDKIVWVSDSAFIFRNTDDGGLYVWENGKLTQLLYKIPKQYAYCRVSPTEGMACSYPSTPALGMISGRMQAKSNRQGFTNATVGHMELNWDFNDGYLSVPLSGKDSPFEFCVLEGAELNSIVDPSSGYEFKDAPKKPLAVKLAFNSVLLLKSGSAYTAWTPRVVEGARRPLEEIAKDKAKKLKNLKIDLMVTTTLEWKYWPLGAMKMAAKANKVAAANK